MTTPMQETVCNPNAKSSHGEPVYKIKSLYLKPFSRYFRGTENLNGSCDHNHAPFRDGLSSVVLGLAMIKLCTNLKFLRSHYEDMKGNKNTQIGVVR